MATATTQAMQARSHRFRAHPPTPIATGKGLRSAAVDDNVLSEYLDGSLRVPDLTLPGAYFPTRSPLKAPAEVDLASLLSAEESAIRRVLAAASEVGAVRVVGGGAALAEAARVTIEEGRGVFSMPEEGKNKCDLLQQQQRWFGRRNGVGEEFYWHQLRNPEMERFLQRTWSGSYRNLRDKMENLAARLETVAQCIANILLEHVAWSQSPSRRTGKVQSVLCLRKYESHHNAGSMRELIDAKSFLSYDLCLHISGQDHEFCIRRPEGSAIFMMPAGDILVTIGKPLQELCNGKLKSALGEILFQLTDDPSPSFSLEYMCSPSILSHEPEFGAKTLSLIDQLLVVLVLALLYNVWGCIFS
ncbi:hypothetical protein Cni_G15088 [Canna indica]|uniref:Isopenicillin N synthase-like Fe(2+) 2OG dioxygenase domain-containing protein n=1 Tax=Canna indica TaxID=4628 RepID=A0AAQ3KIZ0_9LILI|nr:hypothetical protein Cni_G15088 [Canna indica]